VENEARGGGAEVRGPQSWRRTPPPPQRTSQVCESPRISWSFHKAHQQTTHKLARIFMNEGRERTAVVADDAAWYMVWCHERCHKSENRHRCQWACQALAQRGGRLVCFKKARRFAAWINRAPQPRFSLITDWREAQACILAISQNTLNVPEFTAVVCDSDRQVRRAREWVAAHAGYELVLEKWNIPPDLSGGLVRSFFDKRRDGIPSTEDDEEDVCYGFIDANSSDVVQPFLEPIGVAGQYSPRSPQELLRMPRSCADASLRALAPPSAHLPQPAFIARPRGGTSEDSVRDEDTEHARVVLGRFSF
jgi:hypothetical protein